MEKYGKRGPHSMKNKVKQGRNTQEKSGGKRIWWWTLYDGIFKDAIYLGNKRLLEIEER